MDELNETLKAIRKDFYRFRNGIVADSIRSHGSSYKNIFGLLIPQINEISKSYPKDFELAMYLWNRKESREERLIAVCLMPLENVDENLAFRLISEVESIEEADYLNFKILRFLPFIQNLIERLDNLESSDNLRNYCRQILNRSLGL